LDLCLTTRFDRILAFARCERNQATLLFATFTRIGTHTDLVILTVGCVETRVFIDRRNTACMNAAAAFSALHIRTTAGTGNRTVAILGVTPLSTANTTQCTFALEFPSAVRIVSTLPLGIRWCPALTGSTHGISIAF